MVSGPIPSQESADAAVMRYSLAHSISIVLARSHVAGPRPTAADEFLRAGEIGGDYSHGSATTFPTASGPIRKKFSSG